MTTKLSQQLVSTTQLCKGYNKIKMNTKNARKA